MSRIASKLKHWIDPLSFTLRAIKIFVLFLYYIVFMFREIALSGLKMCTIAFKSFKKSGILGHTIEFKTILKTNRMKVFLAHSITLTPGTLTIIVSESSDIMVIHTIFADDYETICGIKRIENVIKMFDIKTFKK